MLNNHTKNKLQTQPNETSPLDSPLQLTAFRDRRALKRQEQALSLRDLADRLSEGRPAAANKDSMPHIKLGRFSGDKSPKRSYRHNAAHVAVTGIEGDYDAGVISPDEAAAALLEAGVAAMIYTSPSHQQDGKGHRWRVLCPLAKEVAPAERAALVARVNGVLGGVLSGESFTASQSFAFGAIDGQTPPIVRLVDGRFLDLCLDLDAGAVGKAQKDRQEPARAVDLSEDTWRVEAAARMIDHAAERLAETLVERNAALCREAYLAGGLLANHLATREQVMDAFLPAMTQNGYLSDHAGGEESEVERIIDAQLKAGAREPFDPAEGDFDDDPAPYLTIAELLGEDDDSPVPDFLESAADFSGVDIPPREWLVPDLIPHRTVTILGGDGGTGKSLLALQLATATVTGSDWIGFTVDHPGPVVYISAEDDRDELHRRMASVTEAEGITFADLEQLLFKSLAGEGAILADLDRRSGKLRATGLFKKLEAAVAKATPALVVLDTLADLHSGDQNDQSHARQFITLLRGLCTRHGCTVLLLHHPSLTGITTGTGTGGSMAWNNSVRSRLYLRRVKEDGQELDPDARVLQTMKANYGRTGGEIALRWRDGVFGAVSEDDESEVQVKAELLFLRLLDEATESGQRVSPHTGANYAPAVFEADAKAAGLSKAHLAHAMKAMIRDERLAVETVGPPSRRQKSLVRSHGGFTGD